MRRSAAILATDVVGYSAMIEVDDLGTAWRLRSMRRRVLEPATALHSGSIFNVAGDGTMASFASAPAAVACAIAIRQALRQFGQGGFAPGAFRLRMGISYGSVFSAGDELYGGPINVAARLEALAEPDDIIVSGPVFERARGLCGASFLPLGLWKLDKLQTPCRIYQVR